MLEESDVSVTDGYSTQLARLQQRADGLALQLSSVRRAASQQAEEYQALIHIKSGLEREIQDYTALLDTKHGRYGVSTRQNRRGTHPVKVIR